MLTILRPFQPSVWLAVAVSVLSVAAALVLLSRTYGRMVDGEQRLSPDLGLLIAYRILFAETWLRSWQVENDRRARSLLMLAWSFTAMVVTFAYSCDLRACLIKSDYEPPIDNMNQFLASNKGCLLYTSDAADE